MPRLEWDQEETCIFENGISNVVLYVKKDALSDDAETDYLNGVAWNGVSEISIDGEGFDGTELLCDDILRVRLYTPEFIAGKISAYSAPKEFGVCQGQYSPMAGVYFSQQRHKTFAISYQSGISDSDYQIHVIYNCVTSSPDVDYDTFSDNPEIITYEWEFKTIPIEFNGYHPFAELVFDSRNISQAGMKRLESIIFGSEENDAYLPKPATLIELSKPILLNVKA